MGGHSIDDPEPKYGLAVTGVVHPDRIIANVGARPGDQIYLTKPLGTGIITTAMKRGMAGADVVQRAVETMAALNAGAGAAMARVGVSAATDITGFGLLGHLYEMTRGSAVCARLYGSAVPVLAGVHDLARRGAVPGGTHRNRAHLEDAVRWAAAVEEVDRLLLCDAQTSGGMLIAVPTERAQKLERALRRAGVTSVARVGEVVGADAAGTIEVVD